jgi:hypothetical protein
MPWIIALGLLVIWRGLWTVQTRVALSGIDVAAEFA